MITDKGDLLNRYFTLATADGLFSNHLQFYLDRLFYRVRFDGTSMLDIGGGSGLFSFYAACRGSRNVICLEPEADGSDPGVRNRFNELQSKLGIYDRVHIESATIQEFDCHDDKFDIVLLHNSVNHLDEEACIALKNDSEAVEKYVSIFRKLHQLTRERGIIIIVDSSRYNVFALFGLQNPFAKFIEWEKHQSPYFWSTLLTAAGFSNPDIAWISPNRLGVMGKILLANRFASYFLNSYFCLRMERN